MSAAAANAFAQSLRPGGQPSGKPRWGVTGTLKRGNFTNPNHGATFLGNPNWMPPPPPTRTQRNKGAKRGSNKQNGSARRTRRRRN